MVRKPPERNVDGEMGPQLAFRSQALTREELKSLAQRSLDDIEAARGKMAQYKAQAERLKHDYPAIRVFGGHTTSRRIPTWLAVTVIAAFVLLFIFAATHKPPPVF